MKPSTENIHWLGHDSFRIEGDGLTIYIDPWRLGENPPPADLVLVTHEHSDHCSPVDVARVATRDTIILTEPASAAKLQGLGSEIKSLSPGDQVNAAGIAVEAVAAYNVNKFRSPGVPFHPKQANYLGFVLAVGGQRIYHTGDSDHIPEMADLEVDIALLPVSGIYVMTAEEAAGAAADIRPALAIPMHVGAGIGALEDRDRFKALCPVPVQVLPLES